MSEVWFTSDLHLGHKFAAKARGFATQGAHDFGIIDNINKCVGRKDKLFILGDVCWTDASISLCELLPPNMELIIGNHDVYQTRKYLKYFTKVHGFRVYENMWLSHCPIHPQEIYRCRGNIHGHIHKGAATPPLAYPYFNVNVDFHDFMPVNFDVIKEWYKDHETRL